MIIYNGIHSVAGRFKNAVIAIGVFDGLHSGHQLLIRKAIRRAKTLRVASIVLTFDPHPVHVLRPKNRLPLLVSLSYRLKLIGSLGVDAVVVIRFTKRFSRLAPEQFIKNYLLKPFSPCEVIIGDDFRFGQDRAGTIEFFRSAGKDCGFRVRSINTKKDGQKKISSTAAREMISVGDLKRAARILGRPVSVLGKVVRGDRRGRTIGFPTANIIPGGEILPPQGVYVVRIKHHGAVFRGMANIGVRPSFAKDERLILEVHFFDFHEKIYGHEIIVEFLHKIRNELYFPSGIGLVEQLKKDEDFSRKWFRDHMNS